MSYSSPNQFDASGDDAVQLARSLIPGHTVAFGWGGRVRVVAPFGSALDRLKASLRVPAFRLRTRLFRTVQAVSLAAFARPLEPVQSLPIIELGSTLRDLSVTAVLVGSPGAHQTIVALLAHTSGAVRATLKLPVAWSGNEAIAREVDALRDPAVQGKAPALLSTETLGGRLVSLTEFVQGRPLAPRLTGVHTGLKTLVQPGSTSTHYAAGEHPWILNVAARHGLDVDWIVRALPGEHASIRLHGDCAPWNLFSQRSGRLIAIDWESSSRDGLYGVDLAHYALTIARLIHRKTAREAVVRAVSFVQRSLGITHPAASAIVSLAAAHTADREEANGNRESASYWRAAAQHAQEGFDAPSLRLRSSATASS